MTHKKMNSKIFNQNRDGITLLFVISMVVLFLLMGTTFMVISNDFYKEARRRSRRSTNIVNPSALLDRCFYDLFRGPDLRDIESPLRGHSILADQYGYGIIGTLEQVFRENPTGGGSSLNPFVQLRLSIADGDTRSQFDPTATNNPFSPTLLPVKERFFSGRLNGQVISIVDGPYDGFSGRILSSNYDNPTSGSEQQLIIHVLPSGPLNIAQVAETTEADKNTERDNLRVDAAAGLDVFSTVVINGRDFSGIGSGDLAVNPYGPPGATPPGTLSATYRFNVDAAGPAAISYLGTEALAPNRFGESFGDLVGDASDYLARENSPNEPYDAADYQNMFLSTTMPGTNMVIPSFHRDTLYSSQFSAGISAGEIRRFSFRAVRLSDASATPPVVSFADTANGDFESVNRVFNADGSLAGAANSTNNLDVDSDGDGINDAVWIDIGLPTQTDAEGRVFKPLVAYRVIDLDNRLNLNAHGNVADEALGAATTVSLGSGYGVAEISLRVAGLTSLTSSQGSNPSLYQSVLNQRYGKGTGNNDPGYAGADKLDRDQKLFSYPENPLDLDGTNDKGTSFSSAFDLLGEYGITSDVSGTNTALPGFTPTNANFSTNPYNVSFSLSGSAGDSLFSAAELEGLLRENDPDAKLIDSRLNPLVLSDVAGYPIPQPLVSALGNTMGDTFTTHSFEVNMPATGRSLPERINDLIPNSVVEPQRSILINDLTPREVIFGGKLNINRYLGNGVDDDNDGIVDELGEPDLQSTTQRGGPAFSTSFAKQSLVRDLYLTFLLACGDTAPPTFTYTGDSGNADLEYHRMVAQWAVNIVDYRDADSINTPFVFDPAPFDGSPFNTAPAPAFTVWGCERPEILISETFAFHDRQNRDAAIGGRTTDSTSPDDDWDSVAQPVSGAVIELVNPWNSPAGFQRIGSEVGNANNGNVNLSATTPGGSGDPVWRIALKRDRTVSDAADSDVLRTVFFVEPNNPTVQAGTDAFFPSGGSLVLGPGQYGTLKPVSGADVMVGKEMIVGIAMPRSLHIDSSQDNAGTAGPAGRALNISDPNGGYPPFLNPVDVPLDANVQAGAKSNRTQADLTNLWVNGVADNYRFVYLQRLADPTLAWNATTNPYLTVDTAGIDLLGMNSAPATYTRDNGPTGGENGVGTATVTATDGATRYRSVERGETFAGATAANVELARRNVFSVDDGPTIAADDLAAPFQHTFGAANDSWTEPGGLSVAARTPFGWLPWNNRPFASHMELLNVPYTSQGMMTFVMSTAPGGGTSPYHVFKNDVSLLFADGTFNHLLNFSSARLATVAANRFAHFFEFVETPSLFLGTETYLPGNLALIRNSLNLQGNAFTEYHPQVHGVPNFRTPGKININTISPSQASVWANLAAGFTMPLNTFLAGRNGSPGGTDPTDFLNVYTTAENGSFVNKKPRVGSLSSLFNGGPGSQGDPDGTPPFNSVGLTDTTTPQIKKDIASSSYFANEFKQKMGNMVTTRSSVFAIWITVGYFQVDRYGRLGAEIATESGDVQRNRGFYIVDRSIPVAFEPGKNHNVDKAVLVRTIIE